MNQDLVRLDRDDSNFTRWQDKLKFMLTALKFFYILDPDLQLLLVSTDKDSEEVKAARKKREEDELICRGHISNALFDRLYDLYTNTKFAKEKWNALHYKYMAEEEGSKKFLVSKYFNFKFFDEKPLLPQIYELQIIVNNLRVAKIELPEPFQVGTIIAKLPPSWKGYMKRIHHKSEDYSLEEIQKHLRIEEESRSRDKTIEEFNNGKVNSINKPTNPRGNNQKENSGNNQKKGNFGNYLSPRQDQGKFKNNKKGACFVCEKSGHYAHDCKFQKKQNEEAKVNAIKEEIIVEICVVQGKALGWWYDICTTVYVSNDKSLFKIFEEVGNGQEIQMGNEGRSKVLGKGSIELFFTLGRKITMANGNASSGMGVAEHSKSTFLELQRKKVYRYVIFKIDDKKNEVVVEKTGGPAESYDDFTSSLPENDCRYAIYDFDYVTSENCQKSKIFFIAWSPSVSRIRAKMLYATSKDRFRRELEGIHYEIQATDPTEMDLEVIRDRAH
ncbi:hypothetical protein LWI28_008507 [Acer negundo]|uniref:Actin-depolymerizing factor n=1 Tax=Acer negundo TaxID=4023 RepID=A0AAD5P2I4_ACENE|nr:hypothetical protein LWI28_008507 [Acer negundo]